MDNRENILNCALALFAARGYDAVGVQEVVDAAGITKPTLYHYYGSKQGLLRALLERYYAPFNRSLQVATVYQHDLPLTLEQVGRAYFDFAQQNPVYYRMQLALYFAPRQSEAYQLVAGWSEVQYRLVEAVFAAAVDDHGNMRGRQNLYAATFIGVLNHCIVLWLNGHVALDDELLRRVVHQFQHGIYS